MCKTVTCRHPCSALSTSQLLAAIAAAICSHGCLAQIASCEAQKSIVNVMLADCCATLLHACVNSYAFPPHVHRCIQACCVVIC
jgi:hypothetical protein